MSSLQQHYQLLLGSDPAWKVSDVIVSAKKKQVVILIGHRGGRVTCPECGKQCTIADHAPARSWRHLDTMQFETRLRARVPRSDCPSCGVKTIQVPWASKHSRFTLMFEAMATDVLKACSTVSSATQLLRINWDTANRMMERAVDRDVKRRS